MFNDKLKWIGFCFNLIFKFNPITTWHLCRPFGILAYKKTFNFIKIKFKKKLPQIYTLNRYFQYFFPGIFFNKRFYNIFDTSKLRKMFFWCRKFTNDFCMSVCVDHMFEVFLGYLVLFFLSLSFFYVQKTIPYLLYLS